MNRMLLAPLAAALMAAVGCAPEHEPERSDAGTPDPYEQAVPIQPAEPPPPTEMPYPAPTPEQLEQLETAIRACAELPAEESLRCERDAREALGIEESSPRPPDD